MEHTIKEGVSVFDTVLKKFGRVEVISTTNEFGLIQYNDESRLSRRLAVLIPANNWTEELKKEYSDFMVGEIFEPRQSSADNLLKEGGEIVKAIHYNQHPSGVECWDIVEHMSYNLGSAIAYIWRSPYKGTPKKDLLKAIQHIQREIDLIDKQEKEE